ncbi:thymidylate kinase [Nostoc phage N1]|nr:thymidylate kinase [Nostoc phage N1]
MKPYSGTLIVFEGVDGAGKTTQANKAYEYLRGLKIPVVLTCEPRGTEFGKSLQRCLQTYKVEPTLRMQTLSMVLDRLEHINSFIRPKLLEGFVVLCDRFTWSSIAYQGSQGVSRDFIDLMNEISVSDGVKIEPDLILLYDTELKNARKRMSDNDLYENMNDTFYTSVIQKYKELGFYWDNCKVIDSNLTIDSVWENTKKHLDKILQLC